MLTRGIGPGWSQGETLMDRKFRHVLTKNPGACSPKGQAMLVVLALRTISRLNHRICRDACETRTPQPIRAPEPPARGGVTPHYPANAAGCSRVARH
jgi:hypothetical protein